MELRLKIASTLDKICQPRLKLTTIMTSQGSVLGRDRVKKAML